MRTEYYDTYWEHPQFEDCTYINWKAALTREHPIIRAATSVLDVGAGGGAILAAIRRPGMRLAGIEISPEAVRTIESRGFEGAVVDLESGKLPYPDASFDVVICYDVFEHLFAPESILAEIRRVLRPEGHGFFCVPNTLNGFNRLMFALGKYVDIMDTSHREGAKELFSNHIRLFSKDLYEKFLDMGGFRPVERHFYFPPEFTDPKFKLPGSLAKLVTVPRLHERFPAVMSLGFLYVCKKT